MLEHVKITLLQLEQILQLTDLAKRSVTGVSHRAKTNGWVKG